MMISIPKILIVDDDLAIGQLVYRFLSTKEYQLEIAINGTEAINLFDTFQPDLIILDVNLPDALGYDLCQQMQAQRDVLVLMLTSRSDESDKITGFSQGADDYLVKPFSVSELGMRVAALLKRSKTNPSPNLNQPTTPHILQFRNLLIDTNRREVKLSNNLIPLTTLEFDLLLSLAKHQGQVLTRDQLIKAVWDYEYIGEPRVVDVHIGQIRKKIQDHNLENQFIYTVRGVGYRFDG